MLFRSSFFLASTILGAAVITATAATDLRKFLRFIIQSSGSGIVSSWIRLLRFSRPSHACSAGVTMALTDAGRFS